MDAKDELKNVEIINYYFIVYRITKFKKTKFQNK